MISIHAPREGSDILHSCLLYDQKYFNPRSPRGERRKGGPLVHHGHEFQSTLPARGATSRPFWAPAAIRLFQSTLPARGATVLNTLMDMDDQVFQSTLPARGAT